MTLNIFQSEKAAELHALCCAAKPLAGWLARDAIQESREACGGHGYLQGNVFFFFISVLHKRSFECFSLKFLGVYDKLSERKSF